MLKDIINFLLPTPPIILMRRNEFPNCPLIFEHISKNPPNPRILGRTFSRLCRISGFSWIVWLFNASIFCSAIFFFLYNWGCNIDMSTQSYWGIFSIKMVLAISATLLFFGQIIYFCTTTISLQLSDRCYEHIGNKTVPKSKAKRKKINER